MLGPTSVRAPGDRVLLAVLRHDPPRLLLLVLTALVATTAGLLLPGALADAVDAAVAAERAWPKVLWLLTLGVSEIVADVAAVVITARVTAGAAAWLRRRLTRRLTGLGARSPFVAGDAVSRVTTDCAGAGEIASILVQLCSAVVVSTGAIVLLALLDWRLAAVFLGSVPIALLLARSHLRLTAADVLSYQQVSGDLSARLLDAVGGLRTIAASGTAEREAARVLRPLPLLAAAGIGMWRTQARMVWRAGLLLPAVQLGVLTAAGFGVLAGRLSIGDVLAALGYVVLGMSLVQQIPLLTTLSRARGCGTRLAEVLDSPLPPDGDRPLPAGQGEIELRGVGVDGALDGIDLTVPAGSSMAVVGRSGAGKTALAAVLGGLRPPDRGEVLLHGAPVAQLPAEQVRAAVGHAFERPALLGATVQDAVAYGSWAGPSAVREACRAAQVHDLVVRLPDGYRTPLEETPLSGGEAQRLGLARALVRKPRLLVLDEATGSLDTVTERMVEDAIESSLPTGSRVVVTHRAGTARRADRVLWLEEGRVRACAPHAELWSEPEYRAVFTEDETDTP
ncbi:ABC transporter ATP-binding protein [Amycolatopsis cihanbeyliensis]|uniref:ATP-binding cassette subfamily B protein n=1 Tax=Amycolatopsis cihanbeyliensis TaxID=1128664 RepID=A0A542DKI6_AMYCI|nr:ATP-binding cassette subfamily B protein [Amycolatopsis cihanbeyliensis]